ncbi:MAG TPA: FkbM family methyltransferase [Nevskia sp.]|nr:FkbM family methyltransferase [Nevskia sp.]
MSATRPYPLRQRIRDRVAASPLLWRSYRRARSHLLGEGPTPGPVQEVLKAFGQDCAAVRFVQVGSNDAAHGDPIMDHVLSRGWSGLLVEPVPYVFERLRRRHGRNPRLRMACTAIGQQEGMRPFYCLEPLDRPPSPYYDQMGSFSREHIVKHERFHPGLSAHIREIQVPCKTLTGLLREQNVGEFELLHIDTEGADFEVLKSLDFGQYRPGLILFEHGHLPRLQREECAAFLEAHGYRLLYEGRDCMALHHSVRERWPKAAAMFDAYSPEP